jgi:hypothetical protein
MSDMAIFHQLCGFLFGTSELECVHEATFEPCTRHDLPVPGLHLCCGSAEATARLYLCELRTQVSSWKNPFASAALFEPQLPGAHFNVSEISTPEEFRVHDLSLNTRTLHLKRPEPCRPIYGDIDVKRNISFH